MNSNEKKLLVITISIGILSLLYVYILEPGIKSVFISNSVNLRNRKYIDIYNRKDEIKQQSKQILFTNYWKNTPQEQQLAFQMHIEKLSAASGVNKIKSIFPLQENANSNNEMALQINAECSINSLTKWLYNIGMSDVPLHVRKLQISGETGDSNILRVQIEIATLSLLPE
ncbi:MAG: hypothetical protein A2252_06350 [Elusimicrobia bacterium RIFOXYA2_FULL_39_19]|nr:MAG: hypothetical protein A2252_06350 [Elusimicrobia bacterium RIFOXYA2_FULL_39_19]